MPGIGLGGGNQSEAFPGRPRGGGGRGEENRREPARRRRGRRNSLFFSPKPVMLFSTRTRGKFIELFRDHEYFYNQGIEINTNQVMKRKLLQLLQVRW